MNYQYPGFSNKELVCICYEFLCDGMHYQYNTIQYNTKSIYCQTYKQHFIIDITQFNRTKCICVYVGKTHNYGYINIISTGLYTTFTGGDKIYRLI